MKTNTKLTDLQRLIEEIGKVEPRKPNEFTVADVAAETGFNRYKVSQILSRQIASGAMTKRETIENGKRVWLYSKAR